MKELDETLGNIINTARDDLAKMGCPSHIIIYVCSVIREAYFGGQLPAYRDFNAWLRKYLDDNDEDNGSDEEPIVPQPFIEALT